MNRSYTDFVKFICCILIFLHHFYLGHPVVVPLGYIGCSIFFFLSAYGVGKSQDKKQLGFIDFVKRRVLKVYVPLLMVNALFIVGTMIAKGDLHVVPIYHIACDHTAYKAVEGIGTTLMYFFDILQTDSATWFIHVLLMVYLAIWALHQIRNDRMYTAAVVSLFLIVEAVMAVMKAEPWYMVDLTGVVMGMLLYRFEEQLVDAVKRNRIAVLSLLLFVAAIVIATVFHDNIRNFVLLLLSALYSVAAIVLVYHLGIKSRPNPKYAEITLFFGGGYLTTSI